MADQHNQNIPAVGNLISSDIPDIKENLEFHKDVFQNFCTTWSDTDASGLFPTKVKRKALLTSDSPYTMLDTDILMECDTSGGAITINVVAAATLGAGRYFVVKVTDATNSVTVEPNGAETIDGETNLVISDINHSYVIYSDGTNLRILGDYKAAYQTERAQFTYNGGATAYTVLVDAGAYMCKDKYCYWASQLTTGAIETPTADTWYYLYLDYSAITSNTAITTSELIWSSTAPTWNNTYRQWMNGNDRCIFAVRTNATPDNILEFFHQDDFVCYADGLGILDNVDIDNVWTDETLVIPEFSTKAQVYFRMHMSTASSNCAGYWRTNGQTGTSGHSIGEIVPTNAILSANTMNVITDSSQIIEVKFSVSDAQLLTMNVDGWYLPHGM